MTKKRSERLGKLKRTAAILFILAVLCCTVPEVTTAIVITVQGQEAARKQVEAMTGDADTEEITEAVTAEGTEEGMKKSGKVILFGFSGVVAVIMLCIVFRSVVSKYAALVPFTIRVAFGFGILFVSLNGIQKIINEAMLVTMAGMIGSGGGIGFEIAYLSVKRKIKGITEDRHIEMDDLPAEIVAALTEGKHE